MQDTTVKTALLGAAVGAGITAAWFLAKQEANTGADAQAAEVPAATGNAVSTTPRVHWRVRVRVRG